MFILSIDVGWKNLSYCIVEIQEKDVKIHEWNLVNLMAEDDKNVNSSSIESLVDNCKFKIEEFVKKSKQSLYQYSGDYKKCKIFIEAQPMGPFSKNLKTKILSHLFQYIFGLEIEIAFINSKNKLKKVLKGEKISYSKLKKLACEHTIQLLSTEFKDEKWLTFFQNKKGKKDDLADCFLQAVYGSNIL